MRSAGQMQAVACLRAAGGKARRRRRGSRSRCNQRRHQGKPQVRWTTSKVDCPQFDALHGCVIGTGEEMLEKAEELKQAWVKGINFVRWLEQQLI